MVELAHRRPVALVVCHENIPFRAEYPNAVRFPKAGGDAIHGSVAASPDCPAHEFHVPTATVSGVGEDEPPITIQDWSVREGVVMPGVTPVGTDTRELCPTVFFIECNLGEFWLLRDVKPAIPHKQAHRFVQPLGQTVERDRSGIFDQAVEQIHIAGPGANGKSPVPEPVHSCDQQIQVGG